MAIGKFWVDHTFMPIASMVVTPACKRSSQKVLTKKGWKIKEVKPEFKLSEWENEPMGGKNLMMKMLPILHQVRLGPHIAMSRMWKNFQPMVLGLGISARYWYLSDTIMFDFFQVFPSSRGSLSKYMSKKGVEHRYFINWRVAPAISSFRQWIWSCCQF